MELLISKLSDEMRQIILDKMNKEYFSTGKFVKDQMSVSPQILSSVILSSSVAGTVTSPTLVYWNDGNTEHCIATHEQIWDVAA